MNQRPHAHRRDFLLGRLRAKPDEAVADTGPEPDEESTTTQPTADPAAENDYLLTFGRRAMACDFEVLLNPDTPREGPEAAVEALELLEELESQWSVYRPGTLMTRVNQFAAERPVPVDERLFQLLSLGQELWQQTEGAFDMTSGPLTKAWGFFRREGRFPPAEELAEARRCVGSQFVILDAAQRTVRYTQPGVDINLGGIGKGFALDLAAEQIAWGGIADFLFHGGQSSVIARGQRQGIESTGKQGWVIGVTHPIWPGRRLLEIQLENQAVGTSGTSRQHFYHAGKRYGHIFDPRTGLPATGVYSSTVIAATAAQADALATAFYVMGPDGAQAYCERFPETAAILVLPGAKRHEIRLVTLNLPEDRWQRLMD